MSVIHFKCKCGEVTIFSAEIGCYAKESNITNDANDADKVDKTDDSDRKSNDKNEEKEKVNAEIATIVENETKIVRGSNIDQTRYD